MKPAVCYRRLQFRSGPESLEFRACEEHRALLNNGGDSCFMLKPGETTHELDPDDGEDCDFCREGG